MSWLLKSKIKTVPITLGFDGNQVVGSATIDLSMCPPTPDWTLSLGFRMYENQNELICLGLIPDAAYKAYLSKQTNEEGI